MKDRVDWPLLMRLGLGLLRLCPADFWAMTVPEFLAALEGAGLIGREPAAMGRSGLERLMAEFPDGRMDDG